jgi:ABC-type antimicrobial peptide transport system permease subunit
VLTKLNRDFWRRALPRIAVMLGVVVTFFWMALLLYGFVALMAWAI